MADAVTSTDVDGETPTQRQARLRREKRLKKMAEQGEGRLAKIKALNGGVAPPEEILGGPSASGPHVASIADDPEEVDISGLAKPAASDRPAQAQSNPLAAAMMQLEKDRQGQAGAEEDPFSKMMQQMKGLMGQQADPSDPNDPDDLNFKPPDIPPWMANMLTGDLKMGDSQVPPATGTAYLWRIVHAVTALVLAAYICFTSTFNGSKLSRNQNVLTDEVGYGVGPRLFFLFTTAELVLQSTRYFLEGGQLQGTGMLATIANSGVIPEPYANYVRVAGRYISIAQTIFSDVMVIIFVFGCMAWYKGMATTV